MNKTTVFAFIFGAAIGAAIAWRYATIHYERILNEELDKLYDDPTNVSDDDEPEKQNIEDYSEILTTEGYVNSDDKEEKGETSMRNTPYIISPDDYGNEDGYDCESLTYYADGILTDDWDNPIENVDEIVGSESLKHFGENKDDEDTVYVRNDTLKRDYEILRDVCKYSDIIEYQGND